MKIQKEDWPLFYGMSGGVLAGTAIAVITGSVTFFYPGGAAGLIFFIWLGISRVSDSRNNI